MHCSTVHIYILIQKWPRLKLFHISKSLSAFIWGNIAFLVLLISEINYPAIPYIGQKFGEIIKDSQQYTISISILLAFLAVLWLVVEFGYNNQAEKIIKEKIMQSKITNLRKTEVNIRLDTCSTAVEGLLWDFSEKGLILKSDGEIFVFWDDISWMEVIEKGSRKSENSKELSKEEFLEMKNGAIH